MTGTKCGLFTHKSVPVIFEPPCIIFTSVFLVSQYVFCGWYRTVILFEAAVPRV